MEKELQTTGPERGGESLREMLQDGPQQAPLEKRFFDQGELPRSSIDLVVQVRLIKVRLAQMNEGVTPGVIAHFGIATLTVRTAVAQVRVRVQVVPQGCSALYVRGINAPAEDFVAAVADPHTPIQDTGV
jgi:hypothetical protein